MSLLDDAKRELPQCRLDVDACRQVAEKSWGHVTEVADATLGVKTSGADRHLEREEKLRQLELKSPEEEPGLLDEYEYLKRFAHGACFYEKNPRYCQPEQAEAFVAMAERLAKRIQHTQEVVG